MKFSGNLLVSGFKIPMLKPLVFMFNLTFTVDLSLQLEGSPKTNPFVRQPSYLLRFVCIILSQLILGEMLQVNKCLLYV